MTEYGIYPGPSSQTTVSWPRSVEVDADEVVITDVIHGSQIRYEPPRRRQWDQAKERVLRERAEVWDKLADL
ncbi:MAG: hypothetical protein MAG451_03160 [Anaerolineales bacterium]|nr:hypothetical protein [Anaerolineales bacterium]